MPQNLTYLLLDLGTLFFPLLLSFDRRVAFWRLWKHLWLAILLPGAVFIVWDAWFTRMGVWGFNDAFLLGPRLWGLPLEEWLFFIVVPYATVFVYTCLNAYLPLRPRPALEAWLGWALAAAALLAGLVFRERWYPAVTFTGLGLALLLFQRYGFPSRLPALLRAWGVSLLPFLVVNGVLTSRPVVVYNNNENLGFRLGTIPFEDIFYGGLLFLLNIWLLEALLERQNRSEQGR